MPPPLLRPSVGPPNADVRGLRPILAFQLAFLPRGGKTKKPNLGRACQVGLLGTAGSVSVTAQVARRSVERTKATISPASRFISHGSAVFALGD